MVPNSYRNLAIWQGDLVKDVATPRLIMAIFASLAKNRASPSLIGGVFFMGWGWLSWGWLVWGYLGRYKEGRWIVGYLVVCLIKTSLRAKSVKVSGKNRCFAGLINPSILQSSKKTPSIIESKASPARPIPCCSRLW